jgi:hypothetical protein
MGTDGFKTAVKMASVTAPPRLLATVVSALAIFAFDAIDCLIA